jgi:O-methyltransferase
VYLCDTWRVVKTGEVDTYYRDGKHDDTSLGGEAAGGHAPDRVECLQGIFPDETGDKVADQIPPLPHRCRRLPAGQDVLDWVWPRLSLQGVVVFDDYGFPACPGITQFVDEQRMQADRLVLHNINGHGLIVKR